jgi:hypothetical protein
MTVLNKKPVPISTDLAQLVTDSDYGQYINAKFTYNSILGRSTKKMHEAIRNYSPTHVHKYEYTFPHEPKKTQSNLIEIDQVMGNETDNIDQVERKLLMNGATFPIRADFLKDQYVDHSIYIKKPNSNRLIGIVLYNIISEHQKQCFGFNEEIFVEKEVEGRTIIHEYDPSLLLLPEYKSSIGKAAAHCELLGMYDVGSERNRIINKQNEIVLFDFDNLFQLEQRGQVSKILQLYHQQNLLSPEMVTSYRNEKREIARRLEAKKDFLAEFSRLATDLPVNSKETVGDTINKYSGHNNLQSYLTAMVRLFS